MSGGGHASVGGHGGMASHGGFGGGHSGGHAFSGTHSGSGFAAHSSSRGSSQRSFASHSFNHSRGTRFRNRGFRNSGFRNNCYWYGCGWGYAYPYLGGGIDPYWWWDSGSSYDQNEDQAYETGVANEMNAQSLEEQRMREQGDQDTYARSAPPPSREEERTEAAPATVLVFRDQHQQEVQNYAIVGQTLWNFAPQHTQKIALSDLDLPATAKANDERGVNFRVPGAREGQ